jgi:uncharacterized protein (TIGR02246 family)
VKKENRIRKDLGLIAATLGLVLTAPVWAAQPAETDPVREEIRAVLHKHDQAMDRQDVEALLALYADDPTIAMMGTGPGEFWKGREEIKSAYIEFLKDFKAGSLKHECPETSGSHHGEVAWLVASCNMQDVAPDGQPREYVLNVSAVLKKENEDWKFQTFHFSNLTPGDPPPPEGATPAPAAPKAQ